MIPQFAQNADRRSAEARVMPWRTMRLLIAAALGFVFSGCLSQQVASDGRGIRQAMIDLYTDQAMDNLVRAKEAQPFVQLAYNNLAINHNDKYIASFLGGDATFGHSHSTDLTKAAPL